MLQCSLPSNTLGMSARSVLLLLWVSLHLQLSSSFAAAEEVSGKIIDTGIGFGVGVLLCAGVGLLCVSLLELALTLRHQRATPTLSVDEPKEVAGLHSNQKISRESGTVEETTGEQESEVHAVLQHFKPLKDENEDAM